MSAKREFFDKAVAELNLDVRDPFTLLFANACALLDQRDELKREVAELRDLSNFINAADISAADAPHTVVEKLQRAMLKGKP